MVEVLARELQKKFPGVQGFSARNLWLMRSFYTEYSQNANLQPMVAEIQRPILPPMAAEISWTKNIIIIQKCKDPLEREFYIKMVKRYGWTKDVLINNIENRAFEKYLSNQTNFDETVPEKYRLQAKLAVKDDYNFGLYRICSILKVVPRDGIERASATLLDNYLKRLIFSISSFYLDPPSCTTLTQAASLSLLEKYSAISRGCH